MERTDDLMVNNLKLIQDDELFCFGHDAVELANFVKGEAGEKAADLCSGNGIIAVLLAGKQGIKTTAIEINKDLAGLAVKNVALNGLEGLIDVVNLPIQRAGEALKKGSFDIVVCNPPYFKMGSGKEAQGSLTGTRQEVYLTLSDVIECADFLLPQGGRLYMVYSILRLAELMHLCVSARLQPKELVVLQPQGGFGVIKKNCDGDKFSVKAKSPRLCLIKCVKGGGSGLSVECREIRDY